MFSLLAAALAMGEVTVRRAEAVLEFEPGLPLGGYTERRGRASDPGGEPLHVRVLVFAQGETKVAVASVELLTIPESLYEAVRAELPADCHLFLAATHTHGAPDSQMANARMTFAIPGIATIRRSFLTAISGQIASAVNRALEAPVSPLPQLEVSQAYRELNRGRRTAAMPDRLATWVEGAGWPLFVHFAAHATLLGPNVNQTNSDWPGALARLLKAPVLIGPIGDVSPAVADSRPETMARGLADASGAVREVWTPEPLRWAAEPIGLDPPHPHPEFAATNGVPEPLAQNLVERFAPPAAQVVAFRMGKLAVVGIPGEPTSHLGTAIRNYGRNLGFGAVLVVSHVNGWIGYILDASDYAAGGYEATLAFHGPDAGAATVQAAQRALDRLTQR